MASRKHVPKDDLLTRLSERNQHILALALLFLLPLILFSSTTLGDQKFMGHDTVQWRAGAESIIEYRAENDGGDPLWASNMFAGMPAYTVSVNPVVPHLDNVVFDSLRFIWPAVPYWVLLGGCYLMFSLMGFRPLVAALGSLFIGFTTYIPIIIGAGHNIKFIAYTYIPWMLSAYWLMTRTSGTLDGKPQTSDSLMGLNRTQLWGFILFAIATTLELRAGHPQVTYYFFFLFLGLYLMDSWSFLSRKMTANWGRLTALIAIACLLALMGTADQYWRLLEYSSHSIRGGSELATIASGSGLTLEYAFRWSQGIQESLTLLIPNLFGGDSGTAYWGEKPGTAGPHYLGAIAALLFVIALFRVKNKMVWLLTGVGLLTLSFSWGYHFSLNELWFQFIPGFNKFRTPEMWLIVTVFCFSIVALYGLQNIIESARDEIDDLKQFLIPAGLLTAVGLVIFLAGPALFSLENEQELSYIADQVAAQNNLPADNAQVLQQTRQIINAQLKPSRRELMRDDSLRFLVLAVGGFVLVILCLKQHIGPGILVLGLFLLSGYDLLTVDKRYINESALVPDYLQLEQLIQQQATPADRFIEENIDSPDGYPYRALPLEGDPFNNAIHSYFYPSIGGYSGAKLSIIQDFLDQGLFAGAGGINNAALDMLNVRYLSLSTQGQLPGYDLVFSEGSSHVYENLDVLPKAWFADSVQIAETPREAFDMTLPEAGFDPRTTAVVQSFQQVHSEPDSSSSVEVESYDPNHLTFNLSRNNPGFLVIGEIYYPEGWTANLNGETVPIYKTNYLLRGVSVPPGTHSLELRFSPDSHRIGSILSWLSNVLQWIGLASLFLLLFYNKQNKTDGERIDDVNES